MAAANYNITVNQFADFSRSFQIKEDSVVLDITGYSFKGELKENFNSTTSVDFTATITTPATGLFNIKLTDTQTTAMAAGTWVYDLNMTDAAGIVTRIIQGRAFISPGVTD